MEIFFSVGEPSGDQHAAHLIRELKQRRPDLEFTGYGGPLMEQAGCRNLFQLTDLAIMGFLRVVPLLWKFFSLYRKANRYFREQSPHAVVLVDYPGFNWWIARKAKAAGIPVYYYLPPQLWAWASWRVRRIRKFVDHVLCGLPFEKDWYAKRGIEVEFVGHPFFDEVAEKELNRSFIDDWASQSHRQVALLPGSRNQEVKRHWPMLIDAAEQIHAQHPDARFLVPCYKDSHRRWCESQLINRNCTLPIHLFVDKTSEVIELAECCMMVSGSVSLEMLARTTPAYVIYHCSWEFYVIANRLIDCRYISLPNLIANYPVMPECESVGRTDSYIGKMADVVNRWLSDPQELDRVKSEMQRLRDEVMQTGATARTADAILRRLDPDTSAGHLEAA